MSSIQVSPPEVDIDELDLPLNTKIQQKPYATKKITQIEVVITDDVKFDLLIDNIIRKTYYNVEEYKTDLNAAGDLLSFSRTNGGTRHKNKKTLGKKHAVSRRNTKKQRVR